MPLTLLEATSPTPPRLFYASDDAVATTAVERLIRAAGYEQCERVASPTSGESMRPAEN